MRSTVSRRGADGVVSTARASAGRARITVRTNRPVRGSARTTETDGDGDTDGDGTAGPPAPCKTAVTPHMPTIIKHFRTVLFQSFTKNRPSRARVAVLSMLSFLCEQGRVRAGWRKKLPHGPGQSVAALSRECSGRPRSGHRGSRRRIGHFDWRSSKIRAFGLCNPPGSYPRLRAGGRYRNRV